MPSGGSNAGGRSNSTARCDANYVSPEAYYAAQDAKEAAEACIDAIIEERGLAHLTGKERREARRLVRRELEA